MLTKETTYAITCDRCLYCENITDEEYFELSKWIDVSDHFGEWWITPDEILRIDCWS